MATLVTRTTDQPDGTTAKGSQLTHAEVDANFINLNTDKVEVSGAIVFAAKAGEALTKGDVVYVSGVSGNEPVVSKADADDASKMPAFGLAEADANNNAAVNVVTFGTLYDLDTSSFSAGDTVYVSTTAGGLTATKPAGEASLIQNMGKVIRSHASAGSIKVGGAGRSNDTPNLNDGNVFIGNSSNQTEARALVEADISDLGAYLTAESDTLDSVTGRGATTTNAVTVGNLTSTGIDDNATSTAITIDASDNVGIGETAPTAKLHVQETLTTGTDVTVARFENNTSNLYFRINDASDTNANWELFTGGSEELIFSPGASEKMRIDSSGNVGIGTTSPLSALDVRDSDGGGINVIGGTNAVGEDAYVFYQTRGRTGYDGARQAITMSDYNASGTTTSKPLAFDCGGSEVMRIVTTGRVGIGTTSPSFPLDIRAPSSGGDAVLRVHNQFTGSQDDAILRLSIAGNTADSIIQFGDTNDGDVGRIAYHHNGNTMRFFTGAAEDMRLLENGNLHVDGNVVAYSTTISDERLKDDVQDITGALDTVDALRGVTYTWNAGSREGKRDYGLIAQEVEQVVPEIVHDTAMPLINGDEETVYKTVDYEKLCAVLINAVSELRAEVEALKNGASI